MDAQWSDDFHHALFTVLYKSKKSETGYYADFGRLSDLHKAVKHAFVYDGQYSGFRKRRHGRPASGLSAHHFVHFDQNHDQVGNRGWGERLEHLVGMDAAKVSLGLLLTAPYVPMLFMGEEWAASTPFLYFANHEDEEMRRSIVEGRRKEFAAFGFADDVPNPEDAETHDKSKLSWGERDEGKHAEMLAWVKALIKLRRTTIAFNDGDINSLEVGSNDITRTLVMERDEARVVINLGQDSYSFDLLEGEQLLLVSREGVAAENGALALPPTTLAILLSSREAVADRQVNARQKQD